MVLEVKPFDSFSFAINPCHNDVFSEGGFYTFGRTVLVFSEELGTRYQVPGTRDLVSVIRYQVSGIRYQVSGTTYQVPGIRYQVPGTRFFCEV